MESGDRPTESAGGGTRIAENVIRLNREWLGPPEELVPIGRPAAGPNVADTQPPNRHPSGGSDGTTAIPPAADAFWSEDAGALHDALQAPLSPAWPSPMPQAGIPATGAPNSEPRPATVPRQVWFHTPTVFRPLRFLAERPRRWTNHAITLPIDLGRRPSARRLLIGVAIAILLAIAGIGTFENHAAVSHANPATRSAAALLAAAAPAWPSPVMFKQIALDRARQEAAAAGDQTAAVRSHQARRHARSRHHGPRARGTGTTGLPRRSPATARHPSQVMPHAATGGEASAGPASSGSESGASATTGLSDSGASSSPASSNTGQSGAGNSASGSDASGSSGATRPISSTPSPAPTPAPGPAGYGSVVGSNCNPKCS